MKTLRKNDHRTEQEVAKFLDKYFYPKIFQKFERIFDKKNQLLGKDIILEDSKLGKIIVDEKAIGHYINKNIPTFAFEISFFRENGELAQGWLFDDNKKTEFYFLIWIQAKRDENISCDDIINLELILIDRKKIIQFLKNQGLTKITSDRIARRMIRENLEKSHFKGKFLSCYFNRTIHLPEKPVNIIIFKKKLIELSERHFYVSSKKNSRINLVHQFYFSKIFRFSQ